MSLTHMVSQSQTKKKKGGAVSRQGSLLYWNKHQNSTMHIFLLPSLSPKGEAIFWGGDWRHAKHRVTETDSYAGKKVIASTGCPHLHGLFQTFFACIKSANALRGAKAHKGTNSG